MSNNVLNNQEQTPINDDNSLNQEELDFINGVNKSNNQLPGQNQFSDHSQQKEPKSGLSKQFSKVDQDNSQFKEPKSGVSNKISNHSQIQQNQNLKDDISNKTPLSNNREYQQQKSIQETGNLQQNQRFPSDRQNSNQQFQNNQFNQNQDYEDRPYYPDDEDENFSQNNSNNFMNQSNNQQRNQESRQISNNDYSRDQDKFSQKQTPHSQNRFNQQENNKYQAQQQTFQSPNDFNKKKQQLEYIQELDSQTKKEVDDINQNYEQAFRDIQFKPDEDEQEYVKEQFNETFNKEIELKQNVSSDAIYTHHNLRIYQNFLNEFNKQLFQYFQEYSKEFNVPNPSIKATDLPLVIRVGFYLGNITFHEFKEDSLEFFEKTEADKKILTHLQNYNKVINNNKDIFQQKINYNEFLAFVKYFLSKDPTIFIRTNDETEYQRDSQKFNIDKQSTISINMNANQNIKSTGLQKEIMTNIQKFENQLLTIENDKQKEIINTILTNLREQYEKLSNLSSKQNRDRSFSNKGSKLNATRMSMTSANRTKEEKREKNLAEIFNFYCKQKYVQGAQHTFDRIQHESNVMEIGKFNIFCKQFNLVNHHPKLMKRELPALFKKNSSNYKEMNIYEFKSVLEKIALLMFEMKDEQFPTDADKLEAFYKYIQIDDPETYRSKFQLLNPAFDTREKVDYRLLEKDQGREIKLQQVEKGRLEELKKKKIQEKLNYLKYLEESKLDSALPNNTKIMGQRHKSSQNISTSSFNINNVNSILNVNKSRLTMDSYGLKKQKDKDIYSKYSSQITWQDLEQNTYNDIKRLQQGQFKPEDLFDENDDPDDKIYLAEYNLQKEKNKKSIENYVKLDEALNYGNYKESLRPSQKYLLQNEPQYQLGQRYVVHKQVQSQVDPNEYFKVQPQTMKNSISNAYLQRAQEVNKDLDKKEKNYLDGLMQRGDQKYQRALNVAKK